MSHRIIFDARSVILLLVVVVLAGCSFLDNQPVQSQTFPTPTTGPQFLDSTRNLQQPETTAAEGLQIPTVSGMFEFSFPLQATSEPVTSQPVSTISEPLKYRTHPVLDEGLNSNWMIQKTNGIETRLVSGTVAHQGDVALAVTPKLEMSKLLFAVQQSASEQYLRDEILGLTFWLYSGDQEINPESLAVSLIGSDIQPYWSADDRSVKSPYDPVFSETRLYYLGIGQPIPPHTWAPVELWVKDRVYDPVYTYITGFYIKNDDSVLHTFYIDDVRWISIDTAEDAGRNDSLAEADSPQAMDEAAIDNSQLAPVWTIQVNAAEEVHPISPFIYGVSGVDEQSIQEIGYTVNSWGGNPSSRFNWRIGHAWNAGRDYYFKNGNYGITSGSASDLFIEKSTEVGAAVRLAVPTLGWVARNDDLNTCSFPLTNGECSDVPQATCENQLVLADPNRANVPSDSNEIRAWMDHLFNEKGFDVRFIAMDNEPELWGHTHYDVHPSCTTYQEILDKFLEYAAVVRDVAPQAEIMGPVTSGWYFYWNSAAGVADKLLHGNQNFLPWFLSKVRDHDEQAGAQTLDILDIHYYPQQVYNDVVDPEMAALRLRSTRSLWDRNYIDESWIGETIYLIPRMKEMIDEYYPGLKLGISEWNWGAEQTMNGALAVADVLGIFGREGLYFASYYGFPPPESPVSQAFKMYTNFDGQGSRFGDTSVYASSANSDVVSSFAAVDKKTGDLHVMLINKEVDTEISVQLFLQGYNADPLVDRYEYSENSPDTIVAGLAIMPAGESEILLSPYSITLLVFHPAGNTDLPFTRHGIQE